MTHPWSWQELDLKEHTVRAWKQRRGENQSSRPQPMVDAAGPLLATVIPVYNEAAQIEACLMSLLQQTLAPAHHMILVLDGGSSDGTQALIEGIVNAHQGEEWPSLVVMKNPHRTVAHARNLALEALPSSVEFLVEMIGHATVDPDHLEHRLQAWERCQEQAGEQLAGVGVRVLPANRSSSRTERWIDGALASPLGQSGGQFSHFTGHEPTKVPAFVMHRRSSIDAVGGWDPAFMTSQDSDLSMRLLKSGHILYRDASVTVHMHKRDTLGNWWKMGHRYGFWRTKVLLKHPRRATWQEFLPLLGLSLTLMLAVVVGVPWWAGLPLCYAGVLGLAGVHRSVAGDEWSAIFGVPLCLLMLHTSFSLGLVDGLVRRGKLPSDRE